MDSVDVIIPVFNRPEYTKVCLDSFASVDNGIPIRPIVVDNGSRRKTREIIKEWAEKNGGMKPVVLTLERNFGFAGAINAVLEKSPPASEHVVVMHNDCVPFSGWAGEMADVMEAADEDVAVVMPRTCYANEGTPCIKDVRERFEKVKPGNKDRVEPSEIITTIEKTFPDGIDPFIESVKATEPHQMYSMEISSFCFMTKSKFLSSKFDTDFWPRGYEDKWWFRQYEREGYIAVVATRAFVFHFGNITSDGPGFSFPDIMKINEDKFRAKCIEQDKSMTAV